MKKYNPEDVTIIMTTYKHEPHCLTLLPKPISEISADVMEGILEKGFAVKSGGKYGVSIVTFESGSSYIKHLYSNTYRLMLPELPCNCNPEEITRNITEFGEDDKENI